MFESSSVEGTTLSSAKITCHFSHYGDRPAAWNDLGSSERKDFYKTDERRSVMHEKVVFSFQTGFA